MVKSHNHYMDHIHGTESHSHDRGTMDIEGSIMFGASQGSTYGLLINGGTGALQASGNGPINLPSPAHLVTGAGTLIFKASNYWTGVTSGAAPNTYGASSQYTASNNDNANENRPENFTVKIWKRTA